MSDMALDRFEDAVPLVDVARVKSVLQIGGSHPTYRPDIDGLRAVAILSVVAFHAAPGRLPGGFVGVDVFFVISGFLITSIVAGGLRNNQFSLTEFYVRRIKRIFPALISVLLVCLAVSFLLMTDNEASALGKHVLAGAGFVSNLVLWSEDGYFDAAADFKPFQHLWSLGIEEQFYLLWPLLLWLAWGGRFRYLKLVLWIFFVSFAWCGLQTYTSPVAAFYSPLSRFWELAFGGGLACWMAFQKHTEIDGFWPDFASLVGFALLVVAMAGFDKDDAFPGWRAVFPTLGAALLIWVGPQAWINRKLLSRPTMVWFGLISYPLYLWHWPLLAIPRVLVGMQTAQWVRFLGVLLAILLAWVTFEFIEKPVRRSSHSRRAALVLLGLMITVGCLGGWVYIQQGFGYRSWAPRIVNAGEIGPRDFFAYVAQHYAPCTPSELRKKTEDGSGFLRCPQSKVQGDKDLVIIGDSHAESLFPGLADLLNDKNVVFYGIGDGSPFSNNPEYAEVFNLVLTDPHIKQVVIAAMWERKLKLSAISDWSSSLVDTVERITRAGKEVYLVDDVPKFSFLPTRCKFDGRLGEKNQCSEPDNGSDLIYMPIFKKIAGSIGSVHLVSIRGQFCKNGTCWMARDGELLFRDEHHLTIAGSRLAATKLGAQLLGNAAF